MSALEMSLIATFLVSAVSLIGVVFLFTDWNEQRGMLMVSFAAGVLLSTAFLDMLPEAIEHRRDGANVFIGCLIAMGAFFLLEHLLLGFHSHEEDRSRRSSGYFLLVGCTVHNFIDGVVIAASFLVSPALGLATTVAVVAHEIPHEVADFGVLLRAGFRRSTALFLNFTSGLAAMLGALWCIWFEHLVQARSPGFLPRPRGCSSTLRAQTCCRAAPLACPSRLVLRRSLLRRRGPDGGDHGSSPRRGNGMRPREYWSW
jgi:zinc and cadmium transporter